VTPGGSGTPIRAERAGPPRRSPFLIPLIALSTVLVLLILAIALVVATRPTRGNRAAGPLIDPCLVGTWRSTSDSQRLDVAGIGPVTVTGQGVVLHIRPDGTRWQDYAAATPYEGETGGHRLRITLTGTVRATIRTDRGTIAVHDLTSAGTVTASIDGGQLTSIPLTVAGDPVRYTCSADAATESGTRYRVKFVRVSPSP
jgi:hypothetical protein